MKMLVVLFLYFVTNCPKLVIARSSWSGLKGLRERWNSTFIGRDIQELKLAERGPPKVMLIGPLVCA